MKQWVQFFPDGKFIGLRVDGDERTVTIQRDLERKLRAAFDSLDYSIILSLAQKEYPIFGIGDLPDPTPIDHAIAWLSLFAPPDQRAASIPVLCNAFKDAVFDFRITLLPKEDKFFVRLALLRDAKDMLIARLKEESIQALAPARPWKPGDEYTPDGRLLNDRELAVMKIIARHKGIKMDSLLEELSELIDWQPDASTVKAAIKRLRADGIPIRNDGGKHSAGYYLS